jgi:HEPN domain-containing protein
MNRREFQGLAIERLGDAKALLTAGRYSGAYYIAGYAVECALKACISRMTNQDDFPPQTTKGYYTHDINALRKTAGLDGDFEREAKGDRDFESYWSVASKWTELTRYQQRGQKDAVDLLTAIDDPQHGVLQWLRKSW